MQRFIVQYYSDTEVAWVGSMDYPFEYDAVTAQDYVDKKERSPYNCQKKYRIFPVPDTTALVLKELEEENKKLKQQLSNVRSAVA